MVSAWGVCVSVLGKGAPKGASSPLWGGDRPAIPVRGGEGCAGNQVWDFAGEGLRATCGPQTRINWGDAIRACVKAKPAYRGALTRALTQTRIAVFGGA